MPPTLRKINEAEPTSTSTPNVPGFEVSMSYPNTMKVLYQLVHLRSLRIAKLFPLIQNAIT